MRPATLAAYAVAQGWSNSSLNGGSAIRSCTTPRERGFALSVLRHLVGMEDG
ncbi:hypothetical protein [Streptomyces sp. DSM 40907]|uniref:hypothetical protein n=1 Tax=Streptomyces kutzneri TaxID=3051179 RepID=UPI0028D79D30|nr:hypothetical protein [Streptomyces sp. DSM 40907]